jgi:bifunctional enzyme CysN/CysC
MGPRSIPEGADLERILESRREMDLLRFITCGSVDDGKSTLIGRLLHECNELFDDQLAAVRSDSRKWGTQGGEIDFALLLDGLAAEREQGITIDVAYRHFSTARRRFIVADTPGHAQYTRNMVTGASTADAAILLVDARKGLLEQTRRHSLLVDLIGIRHVLVVVNKMDLVNYAQSTFDDIVRDYRRFAERLGFERVGFVPLSALKGDNIVDRSSSTPWWHGPTLLAWLDAVPIDTERSVGMPARFSVQWVNRPHLDFRGLAGTLSSGRLELGERVVVQPSGRQTRIARIVDHDGDRTSVIAGQSVTLVVEDDLDISRGDLLSPSGSPAEVSDHFECTVVWLDEEPLLPGRPYLLKSGPLTVTATISGIRHEINVNTGEFAAATRLELNAVGACTLLTDRQVPFDRYTSNRETGGFILIDRQRMRTVGAGMLEGSLQRSRDIRIHPSSVNKATRAAIKHQRPCVIWMTGLSGSGKSTIANLVEVQLVRQGRHTYLLDGDNVRHGLNRDLGFSPEDRVENIRRVVEVASLMIDAGLIVLTALISPYRAEREWARSRFQAGEFHEVHIHAPLEVAEARDPKGLYKRARSGELTGFTGIDAPYEAPERPDLLIDTSIHSPDEAARRIVSLLYAS